jgi:hypothetical protein
LAESSKNPVAASAAAKSYFSDLNAVNEFALKKKGDIVLSNYEKSVTDLAKFIELVK